MTATKLKTKAKAKAPTETRRLGYARASTYGQKIDAQLAQLRAEGCTGIYREKMGGVRPAPARIAEAPEGARPRRRGDRDAHRPARPLDPLAARHPPAH